MYVQAINITVDLRRADLDQVHECLAEGRGVNLLFERPESLEGIEGKLCINNAWLHMQLRLQ